MYLGLLYIRPQDWVQAVLNWPLEFVVAGGAIALGLIGRQTAHRPKFPVQLPLLAAWVAVIFISNAIHGDFQAAMDQGIAFGKRAVLFLMFWLLVDSTQRLRRLALVQVLLIAVLGLQGIWMKQHGIGWAGQPMYWGDRIQWIGLWDGANVLSLLFVMTLPFVFELILGPRGVRRRLVGLTALVLILAGLYYGNSRGAWLAMAVVLFVYFRNRIGNKGIAVGVIAMAALVMFGPSRLRQDDERDESSWRGRVSMWSEGLEMVKYEPTFGIGKGKFAAYTGRLIAHNTLVQTMGETGLTGLFVWLALIYFSFRALLLARGVEHSLSPPLVSLRRAVFVSLVGYLSASFFITTDFEPLYILMGLSAVVLRLARSESGAPLPLEFKWRDVRNVAGLEFASIALVYVLTAALSP